MIVNFNDGTTLNIEQEGLPALTFEMTKVERLRESESVTALPKRTKNRILSTPIHPTYLAIYPPLSPVCHTFTPFLRPPTTLVPKSLVQNKHLIPCYDPAIKRMRIQHLSRHRVYPGKQENRIRNYNRVIEKNMNN